MSEYPVGAKRGRLGFFLILILIALGSILILSPAKLPNTGYAVVSEDGVVEMLQLFLLILSAALYFAASSHAGRLAPMFKVFGYGAVAAAIGEYAGPLESLLDPVQSEWLVWPLFLIIIFKLLKYPKAFTLFWGYASSKPAAGFLLAGIIIAYVFAGVFGSNQFWEASLGGSFHPKTPDIVESYLELLACYFIFISSIGFCIPVTKRQQNSAAL